MTITVLFFLIKIFMYTPSLAKGLLPKKEESKNSSSKDEVTEISNLDYLCKVPLKKSNAVLPKRGMKSGVNVAPLIWGSSLRRAFYLIF